MTSERREKRSHNLQEALELQLKATARRGQFSAVVLTEKQGIPVAAAGDVASAELYAAFAPQLASGRRLWQGNIQGDDGSVRLVTVAPVRSEMGDLFMCAVGGESGRIIAELLIGSRGVNRILA